jgi:predicted amidophosphoribosyltransferase
MNIGSRISVLLMDDVITRGATLKTAISALEASKITVMGAIAACASQHQMRIP